MVRAMLRPCLRAVIGDDVGLADHARGLDRDQLRIAGAESDAPQRAPRCLYPGHSRSLAIALTAAAAIALPPRLPVTTR